MIEASIENYIILETVLGGIIILLLFIVAWRLGQIHAEFVRLNNLEGIKIPLYKPRTREELEFAAGQANESREQFLRRRK